MARDILQSFLDAPGIMGLDMTMKGGAWLGRYYMDGERHPYRTDKLKVKIWDTGKKCDIWVYEQGGPSMSLATWLTRYGGAANYREAYRIIENRECMSRDKVREWLSDGSPEKRGEKFVADAEMKSEAWPALSCPLFRWMSTLFGSGRVKAACELYGATSDSRGLAVWWYRDAEGRICYDKRMRYKDNGRRDKTFGGTRKYKTGDGYTCRPLFGAHIAGLISEPISGQISGRNTSDLPIYVDSGEFSAKSEATILPNIKKALRTKKIHVVESEKTALLAHLAFGGVWLATGGKGNLRGTDPEMAVYPDIDAVAEWSSKADVVEWWSDAESLGIEVGENWDLGDMITEMAIKNRRMIAMLQ